MLALLLLLVFAFETAIAFQDGGALDFVSLFASRPDLLSTYPAESLNALVESLPLFGLTLTVGLLVVALVLAQHLIALPLLRNRE